MKKVYFRDNEKVTILSMISIMSNLYLNLKQPMQMYTNEKMGKLQKEVVNCYASTKLSTEAIFAVELAEKFKELGLEVNLEGVKQNYVIRGIHELNYTKNLTKSQQMKLEWAKTTLKSLYIYDLMYEYLENNLKKVIISEMCKKIFQITYNWNLVLKVSNERLEQIFQNENIKDKENFFCQQLEIWAVYNQISSFIKYEIKERENEKDKKDIFINMNIDINS